MSADVDELIEFKRDEWSRLTQAPKLFGFLRELHGMIFDYVLDFQGLFRSGLCTWFARAPQKVGFADAREGAPLFYKHKATIPTGICHAVDRNIALLNSAFGTTHEYVAPRFRCDQAAQQQAGDLLQQHGLADSDKLVAVGPATRWESKSWPPSFFADTIMHIMNTAAPDTRFWLLGTASEAEVGRAIIDRVGSDSVCSFMGATDLPVMMDLLRRSRLLLTNDSGPMHIAAALGVPTVALFGPTDPDKTGPYGDGHHVFRTQVDCAPCFKRRCPLPEQLCRYDVISPAGIGDCIVRMLAP